MRALCVEVKKGSGQILISSLVPVDAMEMHRAFLEDTEIKWLGYSDGEDLPNTNDHYFDFELNDKAPRLEMPVTVSKTAITADDTDQAVIGGIPEEALLFLDGEIVVGFEGPTLEISSGMPATYRVRLECWPYRPYETEIVAS